jgi:hypothetical protein
MSLKTPDSTVKIGRLRLQLTGLNDDAATEFAKLVAQNLVPGLTAAAAGGVDVFSGDLKVDVRQQPVNAGQGEAALARQIAAEVVAALFAQAAPPVGEL